jgi:phosphate transport system permease protein
MSASDIAISQRIITQRALRGRKVDPANIIFEIALILSLLTSLGFVILLLATVFSDGVGVFQERGLSFFTSDLSRIPEQAGIAQALFGSAALAVVVVLVAFPLGIATAVYLEEYAPDNKFMTLVRLNIRNLAGVPSVVYGLLGLAIFVKLLGTDMAGGTGITGGRTIISGGLTLSVLVLPIVVITSSEALRAVPASLREGAYGVGATKWEVTKKLVLPNALPGILTGTVLSLSRAIGETAPLILVGAFYGTFFTTGDTGTLGKFTTTYTALPQVIYQWATEAQSEFNVELTSAAICVLIGLTFVANIAAILLRNRYEKRW